MANTQADAALAVLARRFAQWRSTRVRGERIPTSLWSEAADLARELGVCRVAQVLRLDYYKLKRLAAEARPPRSNASQEPSSPSPHFIELPPPSAPSRQQVVVELENAIGDKLRIQVSGQTLDVESLAAKFWGRE